ncbi:MAG: 7-cyano-7-deazaguanine synthase QueC [Nitrospiraceae bacterium]|nr:7-cyano-7-deazaguanine synthase QueC [Nitrospiraceae bacterium]
MAKKAQRMTSIEKKKAVVLLSGGIDSSTTLAIAKENGFDIHAISFNYNQRHINELEAAKKIASLLGTKKHLTVKFDLREIGGSALTSGIEVPKKTSLIKNSVSQIPITYVPARNTIFLSFALGWAEVLGAADIFIGANAVDYSGYPDCRPEYLKAFEEMSNLGTKAAVEGNLKFKIHAPLINMTKAEIIRKGLALGLDYALTWSCYDPQTSQINNKIIPCGKCDSCTFRLKGFKEAGTKDPLSYK